LVRLIVARREARYSGRLDALLPEAPARSSRERLGRVQKLYRCAVLIGLLTSTYLNGRRRHTLRRLD
jgi:hypothetical protein